jgi:hypothetical protein
LRTNDQIRDGWMAALDHDGISRGKLRWQASSDAFHVEVAPIEGVVDFDYDTGTGALWIATATHGLFKVFSPYLLRFPELTSGP